MRSIRLSRSVSVTSDAVIRDSTSRKMIVPIIDKIVHVITLIFNHSIPTGLFPSSCKEAQIIPLLKKTNAMSFSEYGPISSLSFLSKVLKRLIHVHLSTFIERCRQCLDDWYAYHPGLRPVHSTTAISNNVINHIRSSIECGKFMVISLLDFSNAFNTVDILLYILRSFGITLMAIDWFQSYLSGWSLAKYSHRGCPFLLV